MLAGARCSTAAGAQSSSAVTVLQLRKILLTQPDPLRLHTGLTQAGLHCDHLPLLATRLEPVGPELLKAQLVDADAVVVASPAAARWLGANFTAIPDWLPADTDWFAPGSGTAAMLRDWGVSANYPKTAHNAAAMLKLLRTTQKTASLRLLWIGSNSRSLQTLPADLYVTHALSHQTTPVDYECDRLAPYARHQWVISSKAALTQAHKLLRACNLNPPLLLTSQSLGGLASGMGYTHSVAATTAISNLRKALF